MTPIIGIGGQAGAGKDTVAGMMMKLQPGSVSIAQADPIKWLGLRGFGFTEEQLWGPSEKRNEVDKRYDEGRAWKEAEDVLFNGGVADQWLKMIGVGDIDSFHEWYDNLEFEFFATHRFSPRLMLQNLGTEYARTINPNVWADSTIRIAFKLLGGGHTYNRLVGLCTNPTAPPTPMVFVTDVRFPNELIAIKSVGGKGLKVASSSSTVSTSHASEASLGQIPDFWWDAILYNNKQEGLERLNVAVRKAYAYLKPEPAAFYVKSFVMGQE